MLHLCADCILKGYCKNKVAHVVTDKEMTREFIQDGRNCGLEITGEEKLTAGRWPHWLYDRYALYPGRVLDPKTGLEAELDLECLFRPQHVSPAQWDAWVSLDAMIPDTEDLDYKTWYRDNLMTCCGDRPRIGYRERLRVVLTLIRALYPERARHWGLRASNDKDERS